MNLKKLCKNTTDVLNWPPGKSYFSCKGAISPRFLLYRILPSLSKTKEKSTKEKNGEQILCLLLSFLFVKEIKYDLYLGGNSKTTLTGGMQKYVSFFVDNIRKIATMVLMNNQGIIILTSTGLSVEPVRRAVENFFGLLPHKFVGIVTTAAEGKENNKYSKLAESQFRELGFNTINFIDIESNPQADFSKYSVVYVCGGNTFKLLKYAREANFKDAIIKLLEHSGIYIGVSAGAIILAPTIQIVASVDPEPNDVGLTDLEGLGLINF